MGDMAKLGISTVKAGKKASMLLIESTGPQHRGNYTYIAKNKAASVNYSTSLEIHGRK